MLKELFETGKTVDAAIDSACEKLGCKREDCEWEIIDLPRKGFLGLKNTPAKVRVSITVPDEQPVKAQQPEQPKIYQPEIVKAPPEKAGNASEKQHRPQKKKIEAEAVAAVVNEEQISEKEKIAREYLNDILKSIGIDADFGVTREHGGSCLNIMGDGLGMIIGRRGETLDAIQYLTGLVANRGEGDYLRLTIDCGDYRAKRKDTLVSLAQKLAGQVLRTNISKTLEPMNPFERRIIHSTISEIDGVSSMSTGEEPNRRVVITSPTARPGARGGYRSASRDSDRGTDRNRGRGPRRDTRQAGENSEAYADGGRPPRPGAKGQDSRGQYDRGRGGRSRQQTPVQAGPPKQTPESEATTGVSFGKIELE